MTDSGVIVVGAGPAGLALGLFLARHRVPTVVLDSGSGEVTTRAAQSCVLRPDTAALLPPVFGTRWSHWRVQRKDELVERAELGRDEAPVHLEQHALERALRAALEREHLARIVTGSHVRSVEQDAHGVTAHTGGANGRRWKAGYLVGCDGARSTIRSQLKVGFAGRTGVERYAVAALRARLPWPEEALLHRDPGGAPGEITARPLPGKGWRLDWLLPPRGELVTPDELLERVHATLGMWHRAENPGSTGPGPYELVDTGVYTAHQRLARHWRVGRAFLAGDAAHLVGALGVQSVDEGLRDAANLAWKLALAWHHGHSEALLDSYEAERRAAVGARLRAVDHAMTVVRREGGGLRGLLPSGGVRAQLGMLTDAHLGRGRLGGPAAHTASPLLPARSTVASVPVETAPGEPVRDVQVTGRDGRRGRLRERLGGVGGELLVLLVAPGTAVWDSRHWLSAGMMPELAGAVDSLPLRAELLVTEEYPGAAPHTLLVVRADGHLVTALPAAHASSLGAIAEAVAGGSVTGEGCTGESGTGRGSGTEKGSAPAGSATPRS
ncbi:FAD-dependent monooxygenase [Actinacidiphila sp. SB3-2]